MAELTRRLHAAGWASHVTVDDLLQAWEQLAGEADDYVMTIDDYTNDLTARDAVAQVLGRSVSVPWHDGTEPVMGVTAGQRFRRSQHVCSRSRWSADPRNQNYDI